MYQPSAPEPQPEAVPIAADRETVIRFVISGPFLNAEARTEPAREPEAATDIQALLSRIGELELQLRDERSRVDALCRTLTAGKPRDAERESAERHEPADVAVPQRQPQPPVEPVAAPAFTLSAFATPATATPVSAAPLTPVPSAPPAPALAAVSIAPVAERVRARTFPDAPEPVTPPKLHALSTVAPPQPPKVRGLRRMIGALRHL